MYSILRRILFLLPAETAHYFSMNLLRAACSIPFIRRMLVRIFSSSKEDSDHGLSLQCFGLDFKNPVGLGAGFDKNARYLRELETLGFGFIEIGTVTPLAQAGNEKPRLFRLTQDQALVNRMGFNNEGLDAVAGRLKKWREEKTSTGRRPMLIGGNIGKNKTTPNADAWKDYETCFLGLHPYVDFFVVNVSSPNTPGLRELQDKESLKKILVNLQQLNRRQQDQRPILLKIAPDLSHAQLDDVLTLASDIGLDGIVATNTTISRGQLKTSADEVKRIGAGGLSGKPLKELSTVVLRYMNRYNDPGIALVGSGGIFSGADAREKMDAGASLVEVWTGFIYEGPFIVKKICNYLHQKK
jgi:dihydroorotate dehydrogenase